ncbi:hypothetical protein D6817_04575 [Candidatus Pacearchaeota archaeon]|nr:MAG: hypothetical protein D6817_04575 [Candidatus Pacearchaeota archaeon]
MARGFIATNKKKKLALIPTEDSFSIDSEGIFAVADGVTRDPYEFLPNTRTLKGKIKFALSYPRPSPAKIASEIFTQTFPEVLRDYEPANRDEKAIRDAFKEANRRIGEWNAQHIPNPDYLLRDFAGCVAAGTHLYQGSVYLGFIADCGVAIFDNKGNVKFRTENQGPDKFGKHVWQDPRLQEIGWENPEARRIVRRDYRNNPSEEHSFGVLTGEENAMHYVRTARQYIHPGEFMIVYTDGLEPIIFSGEFADKLRQRDLRGLERLCREKVRTEGTLIYHSEPSGVREGLSAWEKEWQMEQIARDNDRLFFLK